MIRPLPNMREHIPLAPHTTLRIGGPARYFFSASSVDQIRSALDWARRGDIPLFVLGGGSNVLIHDGGFDGLVLHVDLRGINVVDQDAQSVSVAAASGEPWDPFVDHVVRRGWAGVEALSGIPGSIGATPIQNVGAYGQEVSETIARVEAVERATGSTRWFTNEECRFEYRHSIFKGEAKDQFIITSVTYRLTPGGEPAIRYPELQKYLDEHAAGSRDLMAVRQAVIAIRRRKGMVLDPSDVDTRSDGSFFMNPIITPAQFENVQQRAAGIGIDTQRIPSFPASGGRVKLSAAWLIENAGFHKGFQHGGVGLSSKHTLAIINRDHGTAKEVSELVDKIRGTVEQKFGVTLEPEPNFIGFER